MVTHGSGEEETLRVSTLGGLTIEHRGRRVEHLVPAKAAAVVAYLADTGGVASRPVLAGLLWSDLPEEKARANLRVTLTRLRTVLADRVVGDRTEVRLVGPIECDSTSLERTGSPPVLQLYRGDFLADHELDGASLFAEWAQARREELRSVAVTELSRRAARCLDRGDLGAAAELAARLVAIEPWNESGQRHLITALAGTQGRAAALAQFRRCEEVLRAELGVEPEHGTRALVEALYDDQRTDDAPGPTRGTVAGVRHEIAPLYGRESETQLLADRLTDPDHRLISIVGPGGVGKTRLALATASRVADRFADGVVFAELAGIQTQADVPTLLADLIDPGVPAGGDDPLDRLLPLLADRHLLIVLDNLEHLLGEGTDLWSTIVRRAPNVHLLVTSREEVGLRGEDVFRLAGLAVPEPGVDPGASPAVRLFVERAYRADKSFALGDHNRGDVARLCRLVEGMPLHLELAAATTAQIPIGSVLDLIAGPDGLAAIPTGDGPERHSTFDAVFQHSWELLDDHLREVLARLSVAQGGFDLESAEGAAGASPVDVVRLQRKSLVARDGPDRYRLHELTRQAALRRLERRTGAAERARDDHAAHHLGRVGMAHGDLNREGAAAVVGRLLADLDNLRQAWRHAVDRGRVDLLGPGAAGVARLFVRGGRNIEGAELIGTAVDAFRQGALAPLDHHDESSLLVLRSEMLMTRSFEAVRGGRRALELLADRPDRTADRSRAHSVLCVEAVARSDLVTARDHAEAVWAETAGGGDDGLRALAHVNSAMVDVHGGDTDPAVDHLHRAVALFEAVGDLAGRARAHSWLAEAHADRHELWEALESARRSHRLYERLGDDSRLADLIVRLAGFEAVVGAHEAGIDHARTGVEMYRRQRDYLEGLARCRLGECLAGLDRRSEARAAFDEGIARLRQEGEYTNGLRFALASWARFLIEEGSAVEARLVAEELLETATASGTPSIALVAEAMLARIDPPADRAVVDEGVDRLLAAGSRLWPVETLVDWSIALAAADGERAAEVRELARCLHLDTARAIPDPATRRSYLAVGTAARALRAAAGRTGS